MTCLPVNITTEVASVTIQTDCQGPIQLMPVGMRGPTGAGWTGVSLIDGRFVFTSDDGLEYTSDDVLTDLKITWTLLASKWDVAPTVAASISGGTVYQYTLDGVTRYRFVPDQYDAAQDAFYSSFDGTTLSDLITTRASA